MASKAVPPAEQGLKTAASALRRAATAFRKERQAQAAFTGLAEALRDLGPRLCEVDREAHSEFTDDAASAAHLIGTALAELTEDDADRIGAVGAIADGLQFLSESLVTAASSIREPRPRRGEKPSRPPPIPTPAEVRKTIGAVAFDLFALALQVRDAGGLSAPGAPIAFRLPAAGACGCQAAPSNPQQTATHLFEDRPLLPSPRIDDELLGRALRGLDRIRPSAGNGLDLLARSCLAYFDEYWYVACDNECTFPGKPVPTITGYGARPAGGGAFQPTMDVQWDFCCRNWCLVFSWETFIRSTTVTVDLGGWVNGQQAAIAAAKRRGPAALLQQKAPASPC